MTGKMKGALARLNRLAALRLARANRTVSRDAVVFLAGSIPLDLVARERAQRWALKREGLSVEETANRMEEISDRTLAEWQR